MPNINDFVAVGRCPYSELTEGSYFAMPDSPDAVCRRMHSVKTPDLDKSWPGLSSRLLNTVVILLERKS